MVIAGKSEEGAYVRRVLGERPICDTAMFLRVHLQFVFSDYNPKIVDLVLFKGTFLRLEVEIMLL